MYRPHFERHDIDGSLLADLTMEVLRDAVGVGSFGHRRRLVCAITQRRYPGPPPPAAAPSSSAPLHQDQRNEPAVESSPAPGPALGGEAPVGARLEVFGAGCAAVNGYYAVDEAQIWGSGVLEYCHMQNPELKIFRAQNHKGQSTSRVSQSHTWFIGRRPRKGQVLGKHYLVKCAAEVDRPPVAGWARASKVGSPPPPELRWLNLESTATK
jgi:hypothetical protein